MYKYPKRISGYKYCAKLEPLTTATISTKSVSTVTSSPITSTTTTTTTTTTTKTPLPYCPSNDIEFTKKIVTNYFHLHYQLRELKNL